MAKTHLKGSDVNTTSELPAAGSAWLHTITCYEEIICEALSIYDGLGYHGRKVLPM